MWDEPIKGQCPECGSPVLCLKKPRGRKPYIACPEKNCRYKQSDSSDSEE